MNFIFLFLCWALRWTVLFSSPFVRFFSFSFFWFIYVAVSSCFRVKERLCFLLGHFNERDFKCLHFHTTINMALSYNDTITYQIWQGLIFLFLFLKLLPVFFFFLNNHGSCPELAKIRMASFNFNPGTSDDALVFKLLVFWATF